MRPKKIYINAEEILSGQDWGIFSDHTTEQHTAEYTDLSQVWHTLEEGWPDGERTYIAECIGGDWMAGCNPVYIRDRAKRWAYLEELLPKESEE